MKFLAVLKDSFREATDSFVLYVTLALSFLLILFVGGFSYAPMPAKDAFKVILDDFRSLKGKRNPFERDHRFQLVDLREIQSGAQPYLGEYELTVKATWANLDMPEAESIEYMKNQFDLHDIDVLEVTPLPDEKQMFLVHGKGRGVGRSWQHRINILYGAWEWPVPSTLALSVYVIESALVNSFGGTVTILISIIITAFFIPNMLQKGTVDLLLSKPIGRLRLLIYKYFGGLTFMLVNSAVAIGGVWIVMGLRSGIWAPGFLLSILVLTYYFAILYSISTLFGVLTRSAIISILLTCLVWIVLYLIGQAHVFFHQVERIDPQFHKSIPPVAVSTVKVLHAVTPRITDLDILTSRALTSDLLSEAETRRLHADKMTDFSWTETLLVSGLFISVMLGLACWRFWARDY